MDAVDEKILRILAANAREKASVIGREVNLSVSAVTQRIRKLEDSGVLRQYTAVIDQKRLGNDIAAWMEICLEHPKYYDAFVEHINAMPNVLICHYLTGDFDFMLYVVTSSSGALEGIHRSIKRVKGVLATKTHFVLKVVKENTLPL